MRYFGIGKRIPIAFTKDADSRDISDAIGEFIEQYESQVELQKSDSEGSITEKNDQEIT